jgi:hypothetical protein
MHSTLLIKEMQVKATMRCSLTHPRDPGAGEGMEKRVSWYTGWDVDWQSFRENSIKKKDLGPPHKYTSTPRVMAA